MNKLNLNQKKAIAESINNLSVSIIILGIVTPIFSNDLENSLTINTILIVIIISFSLFVLSNFMLE